jgi:hypothetical protein
VQEGLFASAPGELVDEIALCGPRERIRDQLKASRPFAQWLKSRRERHQLRLRISCPQPSTHTAPQEPRTGFYSHDRYTTKGRRSMNLGGK